MTTVTLQREVVEQVKSLLALIRSEGSQHRKALETAYVALTVAPNAPAKPESCPYCADSHTLGAVYFNQNCAGCVKRMAPANPIVLTKVAK